MNSKSKKALGLFIIACTALLLFFALRAYEAHQQLTRFLKASHRVADHYAAVLAKLSGDLTSTINCAPTETNGDLPTVHHLVSSMVNDAVYLQSASEMSSIKRYVHEHHSAQKLINTDSDLINVAFQLKAATVTFKTTPFYASHSAKLVSTNQRINKIQDQLDNFQSNSHLSFYIINQIPNGGSTTWQDYLATDKFIGGKQFAIASPIPLNFYSGGHYCATYTSSTIDRLVINNNATPIAVFDIDATTFKHCNYDKATLKTQLDSLATKKEKETSEIDSAEVGFIASRLAAIKTNDVVKVGGYSPVRPGDPTQPVMYSSSVPVQCQQVYWLALGGHIFEFQDGSVLIDGLLQDQLKDYNFYQSGEYGKLTYGVFAKQIGGSPPSALVPSGIPTSTTYDVLVFAKDGLMVDAGALDANLPPTTSPLSENSFKEAISQFFTTLCQSADNPITTNGASTKQTQDACSSYSIKTLMKRRFEIENTFDPSNGLPQTLLHSNFFPELLSLFAQGDIPFPIWGIPYERDVKSIDGKTFLVLNPLQPHDATNNIFVLYNDGVNKNNTAGDTGNAFVVYNYDRLTSKGGSVQGHYYLGNPQGSVMAYLAKNATLDQDTAPPSTPSVPPGGPSVTTPTLAASTSSISNPAAPSAPTNSPPASVVQYYNNHPELFADRKVYKLQELQIQAKPDQFDAIKQELSSAGNMQDFVNWLKSQNVPFKGGETVQAAEQIPLPLLTHLAKLNPGQAVLINNNGNLLVIVVAASQPQPVTLDQAEARIAALLRSQTH